MSEAQLRTPLLRRPVPLWIWLSLLHFVFTFGALVVLAVFGGDIDSGPTVSPWLVRAWSIMVAVLMSPASQLWSVIQPPGVHVADAYEHLLFIGNSLLWGGCAAVILRAQSRRSQLRSA